MREEPEQPMTDAELDDLLARADADIQRALDEHVDTEAQLRELLAAHGVDPDRISRDRR